MGGILAAIGAFLKTLHIIFQLIFERNAEIKKKKKEALSEVKEGLKKKDPARITSGFDRINRV